MIPPPSPIGLYLCRTVEFEPATKAFNLIDVFWRMNVPAVPGPAPSFVAFAALRGSQGSGVVRLAAYRLDTHDLVYATQRPLTFPDRLQTIYVPLRIAHFQVPVAGDYEFDLLVDSDIVAQQTAHFAEQGSTP